MKKTLALITLALTLSGLSALGQGYFLLNGPARGVWDGFAPGFPPHLAPTMNVAVLLGPTSSVPQITLILNSTPTNGYPLLPGPTEWNAILNDPNFHLAVDANTSATVIMPNHANGSWTYTTTGGFSSIPIAGTSPGTYKVFAIAWDKNYATPLTAAQAGASVGWSSPFFYDAVDFIGTPSTFAASGFVPFGIVIPEPSTFALASLGGFALMLFRRRNKIG